MNSDFENQLQRQPVKKVPGEWRKDVLLAAKVAASAGVQPLPAAASWSGQKTPVNPNAPGANHAAATGDGRTPGRWWHQLLWPCPQAWGAVAVVWVVIFCLNFSSADTAPVMAAVTPPAPEIMAALKQQRLFKAELIGLAQPAEEPKRLFLQPRSELIPTTVAV